METSPTYVSLTISSAINPSELSDKIAAILGRTLRRSPEDIRPLFERGAIRLVKVLANSDLDKLIRLLEKGGLQVTVIPLEREASSPPLVKLASKTMGSDLNVQPAQAKIDWKEGEIIEGLYEILGSASGGMGKVYFVFHRVWKMMLAIKTPRPKAVKNEARLLRFLREAELWVNLGLHPNIATCYYARVIGGLPRLFIEYVDGGTLDDWNEKKRLKDLRTVVDLMLQFCHGMMHAEEQGMIHRDIKPQNCLMGRDKTLKITDFGLVKRVEEPSRDPRPMDAVSDVTPGRYSDTSVSLFEDGVVGSPWYMAPERFKEKGRDDIRSDIYSFGVMLYEIAVGTMPFQFPKGFSLPALVRSHLRVRPTDPLSIRTDLPRPLADIMMTCLEKKPESRYSSFVDLCGALETLSRELSPGREPRRPPNIVALKADSLNNQAVSLLDLGREEEARGLLEDAHSAGPDHLQAVYNLHTLRWARVETSDREVISRMESLKIEVRETADYSHLMGLIALQRGDPVAGVSLLTKACRQGSLYQERWKDYGGEPRNFVSSLGLVPIGEQASFAGHLKGVISVAFPPVAGKAFSVGEDRSIRIWELESGRCLKNLRTFAFVPVAGAFSPDGKLAATSYGDAFKTVDLWNMDQAQLLRRYQGMGATHVCFSPSSRYLAASGSTGRICILDTSSDKIVRELPQSYGNISSLALLDDGERLAVGTEDGRLMVISVESQNPLFTAAAHQGQISCMDASLDGSVILTGGMDEAVRLWNVGSGKELMRYGGHRGTITTVRFIADGDYIVSGSGDGTVKIWDATSGRCYRTIMAPGEEVTCCAASSDGKRLVTGGPHGSVKLWSLDTGWFGKDFLEPALCRPKTFGELVGLHSSFEAAIQDFNAAWRKGRREEALACFERIRNVPGFSWSREAILVRNALQGEARGRLKSATFVRSFDGHHDAVVSLAPSPDSLTLLTGGLDGAAALWDVVTGRCIRRFKVNSPVSQVLFLPRISGIVTWSIDGVLRRWGLGGDLEQEISDVRLPIALSETGLELAAMAPDNSPLRIDLKTGQMKRVGAPVSGLNVVCFSQCLDTVYNLREEKRIQRWSVVDGRTVSAFRDLGIRITSLLPTASEDKVVAGMETGEIMVYMAGSGVNVATLRGHKSAVRSLASAGDERFWLTGADDCSLRIWDISEERCAATLEGHSSPIRAACFFPNVSMVASGSSEGSVRLWGLEWMLSASAAGS
ncbi:MAG: protein kinase domain-containing protein [Desulfomonilaceae bacterium]